LAPAAGLRAASKILAKHSLALRLPTRAATSCQKKRCVGSTWQYATWQAAASTIDKWQNNKRVVGASLLHTLQYNIA
jgi:hypothetical protein